MRTWCLRGTFAMVRLTRTFNMLGDEREVGRHLLGFGAFMVFWLQGF